MESQVTVAQLCVVDGAWQDAPDNLACFDAAALFEGSVERGNLYILVEVAGDAQGRDALARELIETTRRTYAATRGSIALGLMHAVRAANEFFYTTNANTAPEARRIAGLTAVILRARDLFIAQGGPGVTYLARAQSLTRYPEESPWFNPDEAALAEWLGTRAFATPGEVPLGMRRNYLPDIFHVTLRPGDVVVLATRTLTHLLTSDELVDTLAQRHPDEIVATLEDLAGAADVAVIVLRLPGEAPAPSASPPESITPPSEPVPELSPFAAEEELALQQIRAERERERQQLRAEQARARREKIRSGLLRAGAGAMGALAGVVSRVNWLQVGKTVDGALDAVARTVARALAFLLRAIIPGNVAERTAVPSPARQTAWKLAALALPILLLSAGTLMWGLYRTDQRAAQERRLVQLLGDANKALEDANRLERTDRAAARESAQRALQLIEQARALAPSDPRVPAAYHPAQNFLDELNGISIISTLAVLTTFADAQSQITRLLARPSEVFILDRGLQRVVRVALSESNARPVAGDGVILKFGDRVGNRTVGEIFDLAWVESGRLIALDRAGVYYQFDPNSGAWSARAVNDAAAWARVTLATTYANNLYLIEPARNQILKYVSPTPEPAWSAAVTYFLPGVIPPDLSTVVDWAIDGEVWLARSDGTVARFYDGRPKEIAFSGLDTPIGKPIALFTSERVSSVYIADAGGQRIVQFDKATGRLARQFKPHSQARDAFKNLQAFAVDEPNRKFFFVGGGKAYVAAMP